MSRLVNLLNSSNSPLRSAKYAESERAGRRGSQHSGGWNFNNMFSSGCLALCMSRVLQDLSKGYICNSCASDVQDVPATCCAAGLRSEMGSDGGSPAASRAAKAAAEVRLKCLVHRAGIG
jgi:hypothetical protein